MYLAHGQDIPTSIRKLQVASQLYLKGPWAQLTLQRCSPHTYPPKCQKEEVYLFSNHLV